MSFQARRIGKTWGVYGLRIGAFAALSLLTVDPARCGDGSPDPLLAAGEKAIVGAYKLDHVLLAPGKVIVLPNTSPLFAGMGDTPEGAARKGLLNAAQVAVLKGKHCTMTILADRSLVITNLPSADLSRTASLKGTWSIRVYHVFDAYGYRISLDCADYKGPALHAKFFNADKPDPPILEVFCGDGKKDSVMFRFANTSSQAAP